MTKRGIKFSSFFFWWKILKVLIAVNRIKYKNFSSHKCAQNTNLSCFWKNISNICSIFCHNLRVTYSKLWIRKFYLKFFQNKLRTAIINFQQILGWLMFFVIPINTFFAKFSFSSQISYIQLKSFPKES